MPRSSRRRPSAGRHVPLVTPEVCKFAFRAPLRSTTLPVRAIPSISIASTYFGVLDRDHPVVLSANLAASSCVSFSANEISSSRRDSKSTSERPSCNTPTQVRELRTQEDVFISPDLLADYLEITADARFIGSSNEQQQQDSTRSPTQDFWDTIHQSTISEVAEAAGSSATSVAPSTTCSSPQMSAAASIRRKRWGRDKDDEHRRFHKRPRDNSNSPPAEKSVKFACPYRKHNPAKYGIHESRICALSYWSSISRVKYVCHVSLHRRLS